MTFPIDTTIPAAPNDPADDQPKMQQNFANISGYLNVDHVLPGTNPIDGFHKVIHAVSQITTDPTAVANTYEIYSKNYTPTYSGGPGPTDTQLFGRTAAGGISQLSGNNAIVNGGWGWSGGILHIWGFKTLGSSGAQTGNITFLSTSTITFPNACLNVQATLQTTNTITTASNSIFTNILSKDVFQWAYASGNTNQATGFYWYATGN